MTRLTRRNRTRWIKLMKRRGFRWHGGTLWQVVGIWRTREPIIVAATKAVETWRRLSRSAFAAARKTIASWHQMELNSRPYAKALVDARLAPERALGMGGKP